MNGVKKECLSCTFFRLNVVDAGICRVDRNLSKDFPPKKVNSAYNQTVCVINRSRAVLIIFGWALNLLHLSKSQFKLGQFIEFLPSS